MLTVSCVRSFSSSACARDNSIPVCSARTSALRAARSAAFFALSALICLFDCFLSDESFLLKMNLVFLCEVIFSIANENRLHLGFG